MAKEQGFSTFLFFLLEEAMPFWEELFASAGSEVVGVERGEVNSGVLEVAVCVESITVDCMQ